MANVEVRFKETSLQTNFQSNETDESGDDCSPFCICSCCHFSTAYQFKSFSVTNKMTDSAILTPQDFYQSPYNQVFKASIWQPPKFNLIG